MMTSLVDIRKTELELRRLHQEISSLSNQSDKEAIARKVQQLDFDQETAIMNVLEKTDQAYDALVQENFDLLINDRIEFNVVRSDVSPNSHAIEFDGKVHDDGLFYCHSAGADLSWLDYYPLSYVGLMNYFGEADIYMDKKKYKFFSAGVPQKYVGSINTKGGLFLEATESFWDRSEKIFVNHVTANLFSGDSEKRMKFMSNRQNLKNRIIDFRDNLN